MAAEQQTPFAMFVSAVKGKLVSRYGTATLMSANEWLGARRDPETQEVVWDEETIYALTAREASRFAREYARAFRDGALKKRTEDEYLAWCAAQYARKKQMAAKLEAQAKAEAQGKAEASKTTATAKVEE